MNKAQKKARELYNRNKRLVEYDMPNIEMRDLCRIALEQDRLYKVINERADKANFNV